MICCKLGMKQDFNGKRRVIGALMALITATVATTVFAATPTSTTTGAEVTLSLQAKLFQHVSGTFSKDVLLPDGPALGNVVAGDDASTSTFVTVLVALAPGVVLPSDSRVRLQVRAAKNRGLAASVLLDRTEALGSVDRCGRMHIGFWLPKTGCRPLALKATLSVARQPITRSTQSELAFRCGE